MVLLVYEVATAAITGALIIPLFVLWVCGLCLARRRGDPARTGFRYLHVALPFETLSLIFNVANAALVVSAAVLSSNRRYDTSLYYSMLEANRRIASVRTFFEIIATVLCIPLFTELGNGFTLARKGARDGAQKALRFVAIGAAIIMFIIGLSYFGVINAAWSALRNGRTSTTASIILQRNGRLVIGAWYVLMFIVSLLLLIHASIVVHKSRMHHTIHNSSVLYLVATVFFFIRFLYCLIFAALFILSDDFVSVSGSTDYISVIDAVFNDVFFFIALVLIVCMGFRKNGNGLQSTDGPLQHIPNQQVIYTQPQQGYYPQQQAYQQQPVQQWQYPQGQPQQYYVPSQYPTAGQPVQEVKQT